MRSRTFLHFFDKLHKNANKKLVFLDRVDSLSDNVVSRSHKMSHIQRRQTGRVERSEDVVVHYIVVTDLRYVIVLSKPTQFT